MVVEMDGSGPAVQFSGIEVTVTVMLSIQQVSSDSRWTHEKLHKDRIANHHVQQGHRTCERDVPRALDRLSYVSVETGNRWDELAYLERSREPQGWQYERLCWVL